MSKIQLPDLPYAYDALEPVIDAKTMEIHHGKHHAAYVNNLNAALEKHPEIEVECMCDLLSKIDEIPADIQTAVRNNGGGHHNHKLFWKSLAPVNSTELKGELKTAIESTFGSYESFVEKFSAAATTRFGSGWAWLVMTDDLKLEVISTPNQDSPLFEGKFPLLGLDVWEHAYYLNYQNRRPDYVKAFFSIVNWDFVAARYLKKLNNQSCCRTEQPAEKATCCSTK